MRAYLNTKLDLNDATEFLGAPSSGFSGGCTTPQYAPDIEIEPKHTLLELDVDVPGETLKAKITHTVEARTDGRSELKLNGVAFRDVIVFDADGGAGVSHSYDGQVITIRWAKPFEAAERRRVTIAYTVHKPTAGLYFSNPDKAYPKRPVWAATDHETERARHWFATIDLPECHPTLDFTIRHDAKHTALANGALVSSTDLKGGRRETKWKLEQPCPSYITCWAVGDFIEFDDGVQDGIPCKYYTTREHQPADLQRAFGKTKQMLAWMQKKLGLKFPYPKYYQFCLMGIGGAMENISLVSWEDQFVLDETMAKEWTWLVDQINLHEMSHSYFGDAIICRDYAQAWLKESWATYTESLWLEDSVSHDEYDNNNWIDAHRYFAESDTRYTRPIFTRNFESSWDMYDGHLYPGGAMRLNTLRKELGDAVFFEGVKQYVNKYCFSTVETEDFRRVMEEVSGRSLGKFFDQWFCTAGYPTITVTFAYDAAKKSGTFTVEQKHTNVADGQKPIDFVMRSDIGWTINGRHFSAPVELSKSKHEFTVAMDADPQMVRFDPHGRVLHKLVFNPGTPRLLTQLSLSPDVTGRMLAAGELAKLGTVEALDAIAAAYRKETFWGTRCEFAKCIGRAASQHAAEILAALVGEERDGMVLEQLIVAAGGLRDDGIADALAKRIKKGDLPYRAHSAACQMYGAQRAEGAFALLKAEYAKPVKHVGFAHNGVVLGIANLRSAEAAEWLLAHVAYGKASERTRPTMATALGMIGDHVEKPMRTRIVEALTDLLRDPTLRVRKSAAAALSGLRAGASAINAMAATLSWQEQVAMARLAKSAGRADDPKVGSLEKTVADLSEKLRKLEAKLDKPAVVAGKPAGGKGASGKAGAKKAIRAKAKPAPKRKATSKRGK